MSSFLDRSKSIARKSTPGSSTPHVAHHPHHKPEGGRPSDHLINRGEQWRLNVKAVHDFYAAIASSERHSAAELQKASNVLPLPFTHGAQFNQEEGGWQHTLIGVRDQARKLAEIHEQFAKEIEEHVLADLNRTKHAIKAHTKEVANDAGKLADETDQERKLSTTALSKHGAAISTAGRGLAQPIATDDPYVSANVVDRQLVQQLEAENRLTKSLLHHQTASEDLEKRATTEIQAAAKAFTAAQTRNAEALQTEWATLDKSLASIDPAGEWASFKNLEGAYVDPETTQLRDPSLIAYPHQRHESAEAKWTGTLERKKRFAKSYVEVKVVVTASGFLHTYPLKSDSSDPKAALPDISLYLPAFALGPQPSESSSKHKIYIEGRKAVKSGAEGMMKKVGLGKREIDYTFRAATHAEIIKVWGIVEPFTREVLTVTPAQTKRSSVPAVVANVGLPAGKEAAQAQEAAGPDEVITADHVADAEAESGPIHHGAAASADDEEERGGSSDEEEVYAPASATTPAVEKGKEVAEGESLPNYAPGELAPALADKKAHFAADDDAAAASSGPQVGGSAAALPGSSHTA